ARDDDREPLVGREDGEVVRARRSALRGHRARPAAEAGVEDEELGAADGAEELGQLREREPPLLARRLGEEEARRAVLAARPVAREVDERRVAVAGARELLAEGLPDRGERRLRVDERRQMLGRDAAALERV